MTSLSRRHLLASGAALGAASLMSRPAFSQAASKYPAFGTVERLDPALDALIDSTAVVEDIYGGFTWSEGPVWVGGADGYLLVSDPRQNAITQWSESRGGSVWLKPSGKDGDTTGYREPGSNGLFLGRGGLVVADSGGRGITHIDLVTKKKTPIVREFEGKKFNSPNDLCVSPVDGSIYFSDPPYGLNDGLRSPLHEMDYTGVFRVAPDNTVTLIGKYQMPNGIGISPDGRHLYHTDGRIGWVEHTLDAQGRSVSERPFIDRAAQGMPANASGDSLKIDAAGNMWTSGPGGINIISPAGKRLGVIHVNDTTSNCEIGGDGYLYMSSNTRITRIKLKGARKLPSKT